MSALARHLIVRRTGVRLVRWMVVACASAFAVVGQAYEMRKAPPPIVDDDFRWSAYRRFSSADGLPSNTVNAFAQDKQGFVYAATANGFAKFDGRVWHGIELPTPSRNVVILKLTSTDDGSIWVGTDDAGLFRYFDGSASAVPLPVGATEKDIDAVIAADSRSVYAGTSKSLYRCDKHHCDEIVAARGLEVAVLLLGVSEIGRSLWVGTNVDGLYRIDGIGDHETPTRAAWHLFTPELGGASVRALAQWGGDDGNDLWVGTGFDLARVAGNVVTHYSATSKLRNGVRALLPGKNDRGIDVLHVGFFTEGTAEIKRDGTWTLTNQTHGLPDDDVITLFQTDTDLRSPVLWIGMQNAGVARRDIGVWSTLDERSGLPSHLVQSMGEVRFPDGNVSKWIGTSAGVVRWHDQHWQSWLPPEQSGSLVNEVIRANDRLWLGTYDGLLEETASSAQIFRPKNSRDVGTIIEALYVQDFGDDFGDLWLGTHHGLGQIHNHTLRQIPVEPLGVDAPIASIVRSRAFDRPALWVAGPNGMAYQQGAAWKSPPVTCVAAHQEIFDLRTTEDVSDSPKIWLAHRHGVTRLDPETMQCNDVPSILVPDEPVTQIQIDRAKRVYVFGKNGVQRLTPDPAAPHDLTKFKAERFGLQDGLPALEFNSGSMTDAEGRIWAATAEGAVFYDPRDEVAPPAPRPFRLLSADIEGTTKQLTDNVELDADENNITFEFSLLSNQRDRLTRYRTELVGSDEPASAWIADGRRVYRRLPSGNYTFRAFARDGFGVEASPVSRNFSIRLPLWREWWALACYALSLIGVMVAISRWRISRLRRASKLLEQIVEERTASLQVANAQLEEARKTAEAATQSKSVFLANMSHEIRTPMNAVLGFASLGARLSLPDKAHDYFRKITNAGQNLLNILNDILDFSKIEAGKLALETVPFSLSDVLAQVTDLFALKASEKNLEFVVGSSPGIPDRFIGDPLRLGQVLLNLVNNAIKFTQAGYVQLYVEPVEAPRSDRLLLRFCVEDSGIGMSEEQIARLFQPFSQADHSTTRNFGGTGLGLTISQRLVAQMGGVISTTSYLGAGSAFCFEIGLKTQPVSSPPYRLAPEELAGLRILVVDDSQPAREWLSEQLAALRFDVACVDSGEAALDILRREPFALIMMDWMMPGIDGIETTRRIQSDIGLTTVPEIIMVTAHGREAVQEAAEAVGVHRFLIKPVNPSVLLDTIVETLSAAMTATAVAPLSAESEASGTSGNVRVLLAEDNLINQQLAIDMFAAAGIGIEVAGTGVDAVAMAEKTAYAAIFMDIEMPAMDGYTATMKIRERLGDASPPIIAMTAHASSEHRQRCLDAGMTDFITKPILFDDLMAMIEKWIGGVSIHPPAAEIATDSDLDGIDRKTALGRMRGNTQLFDKLLALFPVAHAGSETELRAALQTRDLKKAARVAHSVAGAAGNIGATRLHELGLSLETAMQESVEGRVPRTTLDEFLVELRRVLLTCQHAARSDS